MRKFLSALTLLLCLVHTSMFGQVVNTSPVIVTQSSTGIVITFNADAGNKGLMGVKSPVEVYAHTGVITNLSTNGDDWKHATDWNTNNAKYRMTYKSANTWTLTIPDIREFYGITSPDEQVRQLAFVFRTADRTKEGKTACGGNIYVEVFPTGFPSSTPKDYPSASGPTQGPVTNSDGSVTFCLAAPSKTDVLLVGSWNDYSITPSQMMHSQVKDGVKYFWTTVGGLTPGKDYMYYFLVDGATRVCDPYARLILDPFDDRYISSKVFPDLPAYPSTHISGVPVALYNSSLNDYAWTVTDFKGPRQSDLIIYEILVRDFTGDEGYARGNGTIAGAMAKLDYLKELGVNAVELMPITEFSGNNSWGYNPNFYFAPDKAYGTPADYKAFIDAAHERGLAVIIDMVFNQSDSFHPWYNMYTQRDTPFYNGSAPHDYSVFNDWKQEYTLVERQWMDALDYWLTEYKVDGFRFDLVKGLGDSNSYGTAYYPATNSYAAPSAVNTDRYNSTRVKRMCALRDHIILTRPDAYFINENLAGAIEENEMAADGEINWANVNTQACEYAMGYLGNASLDRFYAPLDQRTWGSTVSYAVSHDEERPAFKQQKYATDAIIKDASLMMRRLGSLAAQMLLTPGAHMIWQFEELAADQSTKSSTGSNDTSPRKVIWNYLNNPLRRSLHDTYATLCNLRTGHTAMFQQDVSCKVSLSSATARYISLVKDNSELYLVVNPAVSTSATISPVHPVSGAKVDLSANGYTLLAVSPDVTPAVTSAGVTLPGGAFAVYARDLPTGIDDILPDASSTDPAVRVINGIITPTRPCTTFTVHTLSGTSIPTGQPLTPGIYIATIDGTSIKVAVTE